MKIFLAMLCTVSLFSCTYTNKNRNKSKNIDSTQRTVELNRPIAQPKEDIFGIQAGSITLFLLQWDTSINLQSLSKPIKQRTIQLEQNADTHAGSYIKHLEYNGLKLQLFSPKGNGKSFWIQEIILTNKKYNTINEIRIGDSFDKVSQAYPLIQKFPGQNQNMYYISNKSYEKSIELEFLKDTLKSLRMYYAIN